MDIKMNHRESGCGEPLVLLHGNGEDGTYFAHQMEFFGDRYRVIAPDARAHGLTPRGTAPLSLSQFACDLADFLDELGIESAHVLGFSDGANTAMLFALAHPGRVRSLVLNGGNLFPEGLTSRTRAEIDEELAQAQAAGNERQVELLRLMVDEPHIDPADLLQLNMPTLVVAGTDDMIDEAHTRLIAASIPGAQLSIIPGTHFVAAENPAAFNAVVAAFLSKTTYHPACRPTPRRCTSAS